MLDYKNIILSKLTDELQNHSYDDLAELLYDGDIENEFSNIIDGEFDVNGSITLNIDCPLNHIKDLLSKHEIEDYDLEW